jgi:plastocyanin
MKKLDGSISRYLAGVAIIFAIVGTSNNCTKSTDNMPDTGSNTDAKGTSDGPGTNEVWIQGMAFIPSTITVAAGTTITWTNKDATSHTVTSNTALFDSGTISSNGTYSFKFTVTGTFQYHCTLHPSMTATVIVN